MTFDPTITIGGLFTLIATLGLYLYQWLDKGRARRWANEDAALVALDLKAEAAKIADKVSTVLKEDAAKVALAVEQRDNTLVDKVGESITTTTKALKESNEQNKKIADLTALVLELQIALQNGEKRRRKS